MLVNWFARKTPFVKPRLPSLLVIAVMSVLSNRLGINVRVFARLKMQFCWTMGAQQTPPEA